MPGSVPNARVTELSVMMPGFESGPSDASAGEAHITAGDVQDDR